MRKIPLVIIAMYAKIVLSIGQTTLADTTTQYTDRRLKVEEINFVSGYYQQDGNHSAVTGGIGTEFLTDYANTFDIKASRITSRGNKHSLTFELGIDHYTSASSANIDPRINVATTQGRSGASSNSGTWTGASRADTRIYPSVGWQFKNENKGWQIGANGSFSTEYDYKSYGGAINFAKTSRNGNREISAKLQAFLDTWMVIYPYELTPAGYSTGAHNSRLPIDYKPRNSYEAAFAVSQVINKRLQMSFLFDVAHQEGHLQTSYQRVYFTDNTVHVEKLPDKRWKFPVALRANYFVGDKMVLRAYYRYYQDNWGMKAHTASLESSVKITPFFSISPFYRITAQQQTDYFAAYRAHTANDAFYTSDYDLSSFTSQYFGAGLRLTPPDGVLGLKHWNMIELRYGRYLRNDGLQSHAISLNFKFK